MELVIQERLHVGINNVMFVQMVSNLNEFLGNKTAKDIELFLAEKQIEFEKYFENKYYILENYIVYNLYTMYMKALETRDLNKEISRLMISYSLIKLFLISTWTKNNGELVGEDIVNVLYCISRMLEHDEPFIESLYRELKIKGYDTIGYLVTMIY